jgi:protein phosphatase 2C
MDNPGNMASHGVKSVQGLRAYMEDAHAVVVGLIDHLDFYAVYDGHGGKQVAEHCADTLHVHLKEQLEAGKPMSDALMASFEKTDAAIDDSVGSGSGMIGSTAVVVVRGPLSYWVANCGDSRAVLCRDGECHAMTSVHHPDDPVELVRINESGGIVVKNGGIPRVMGLLSMSRAIGDHDLTLYGLTWRPDVREILRTSHDEFLLLASDGLFDVMSDAEAVTLARRSLERAFERCGTVDAASTSLAARIAASVLTKMAISRGSRDNVTVVIVLNK